VVAGVLVGQAVLYGPALVGRRILLPLEGLAEPGVYLPSPKATAQLEQHDLTLTDLIYVMEPARRFAASELAAGRLPLWTPHQFAGAPVPTVVWSRYSPFLLLASCTSSPFVLPWIEMLMAMVAGIGAYLFFRRVLEVGLWPAVVVAWCFPLTGFFVFWQGFRTATAVVWLPWLLLAVDRVVRRSNGMAAIGLGTVTGLLLICGQLDNSAQVLLASGIYALWRLADAAFWQRRRRQAAHAILVLTLGWGLGLCLSAPSLLPEWDYVRSGSRMLRRATGEEARPPVGLSALPQVVLPDMYGATRTGSFRIVNGSQNESSAAAYPGLLMALVLAPLAWTSRRHRALNGLWCALGFFALGWCLNVPGLVTVLRLPGLNLLSHNRFVFATSFSLLALGAVGLDVVAGGRIERRWWFWLPAGLLLGLAAWCCFRAVVPPLQETYARAEQALREGGLGDRGRVGERLQHIHAWFVWRYAAAAVLCGLGCVSWLLLWFRRTWSWWVVPISGVLLLGDLAWFGHGRSPQSDPALYYPRIPALEQIAHGPPGRMVGYHCLPAALAQIVGLRDIRGYDGVDPARLVEVMMLAAGEGFRIPSYALTQWYVPRLAITAAGELQLSPIMDMLNVRYVVFRGTPPKGLRPEVQSPDYWVMVNRNALPRAFVPRRVERITDDRERLGRLGAPSFDPREVAYVESPVGLPSAIHGSAEIVLDLPTHVRIEVSMDSPGLVVLADLWDVGWRAYLHGRPLAVLRVNHTLRGVVVPAGNATLEFRYEPAGMELVLGLAGLAVMVILSIVLASRRRLSRRPAIAGSG
jgi:hypothetical protein